MKTVLDVNGVDITSQIIALLQTENALFQTELFAISTPITQTSGVSVNPLRFLLTPNEGPIYWPAICGTPRQNSGTIPAASHLPFFPASIKRDAITFELGLAASDFKIYWASPPSVKPSFVVNSYTKALPMIEHFRQGAFDNGCVRIWRAFMSGYGGGDIFGVAKWTSGRIADVEIDDTGMISITVKSYLDLLDAQVPRFCIEAGNRVNQLGLVTSLNSKGTSAIIVGNHALSFVANANNRTTNLAMIDQNDGTLYPDGSFDGMWCYVAGSRLMRIAHSYNDGMVNFLTFVGPLPEIPLLSAQCVIYQSAPVDVQTPGFSQTSMPGFPYLPRPEDQF